MPFSLTARELSSMFKRTITKWNEDNVPTYAASLAYYTVFSVAPTLILVMAIAGLAFGQQAVRGELYDQVKDLVGPMGAQAVEDMVASASKTGTGVLASLIGVAVLVIGATSMFAALQEALNHIWKAPPRAGSGILSVLRSRLLSFTMVFGLGFLLLVTLVVSAAVSALSKWMDGYGVAALGHLVDIALSFGVVTVMFAMIYKVLPDVRVAWRDVWLGAVVTAVLFNLGKFLIGLYIGNAVTASSYGAAGSLAALLIWVYYSSMVLFLGAEFTNVYATAHGSRSAEARAAPRPSEPRRPPYERPPATPATTPHGVST